MSKKTKYAIISKATKNVHIVMMRDIFEKEEAEKMAERFPGKHNVVDQSTLRNLEYNQYKILVKHEN